MIPLRLELRNFMSYGENVTPLDLRGIHIACLSGDNGNGKSALLDAITWALWGEARASDDELIRLGSDEMRVVFDFQLGDDVYRVIRGRSKKSSSGIWELYIADNGQIEEKTNGLQHHTSQPSPTWRPLTGQGLRETGRQIKRILRMDYRTFINSAYIQQGRADEFTKQTVSDRKKILADILDLGRYDALEQKAKDRRNQADQQVQELSREIETIEAEIANENELQQQLNESIAERNKIEKEIASKESELKKLMKKQAELEAAASQKRESEKRISELQKEIDNLIARKSEQEQRIKQFQEIIKDKERILAGMNKLTELRNQLPDFEKRLEALRQLELEQMRIEQAISNERHKIELEFRSRADELGQLLAKIEQLPAITNEVETLQKEIAELDKLEIRRNEIQTEITNLSNRMGELKALHERLPQEKKDLEEKLRLLSEPGARCPVCRTELGKDKHAELVNDYKMQIEQTENKIKAVISDATNVKKKRASLETELANIENKLKKGRDTRHRLAQAEQVQLQILEAKKQEPSLKKAVESLQKQLETENFAHDLRLKLKKTEEEITSLGYDTNEHNRIKEEIKKLEEFEALAANLKVAEESLPTNEENLRAINELIASRQMSIAEHEKTIKDLEKLLLEFDAVITELNAVSKTLEQLRELDRQITGRIANLRQSIERCKALREKVDKLQKDLEKAKKDRTIYNDLVTAFGKKGVQALIIENAIPEIQEEANRLLARMTDNSMQVSLETLRDKKTGGTAETLDIKISDDMGTRSYELYSGGEAFRVNLALRIALSKLLARRAGARLQTLIIDEGFGTQDGKGREKLVDAINSIKDDFEKILVITHIDELKDAFPTRIEITKDLQGSKISIS